MNPQIHHNRRTTISTPFTRLRVNSDWPHDIYTLRGSPVARDRGSAQWQVFYWGRVEKSYLNLTRVLCTFWFILSRIYRQIRQCRVCVYCFNFLKMTPPPGWSEARHLITILVSLLLPEHGNRLDANTLARKAIAHGLFPCFSGRIGS